MNKRLPKILYISDVPVEYSSAGGLFMYRLFEAYPKDKLLIVHTYQTAVNLRLTNATYLTIDRMWVHRIKKTRFQAITPYIFYALRNLIPQRLTQQIQSFKPDCVITITQSFAWLQAMQVAKKYRLPLHLILHDNFFDGHITQSLLYNNLKILFANAYRQAFSRFCISESMELYYRNLYGIVGDVIYPFHGKNDTLLKGSMKQKGEQLHFCYAGQLYTGNFLDILNWFVAELIKRNWRITIFSNIDSGVIQNYEYLNNDSFTLMPFNSREKVNAYVEENIDVSMVLSSLDEQSIPDLSFSSKIADCIFYNIPTILFGLPNSGIINWAKKINYPCIVQEMDDVLLNNVLDLLVQDEQRICLRQLLVLADKAYFDYEKTYQYFINKITQSNNK